MDEKQLFSEVKNLEAKGFLLNAVSLIDKNINQLNCNSFSYWEGKKEELKTKYNEYYSLNIGEALFPVIDESNGNSFLAIIKLTENDSTDNNNSVIQKHVQLQIIKALNEYLKENFDDNYIRIFDWKLPDYNITILKYRSPIDYSSIKGKSYELALSIAYISKLLEIPVKDKCVFSGVLSEGRIGEVDYLEQKNELSKNVFGNDFSFCCNSNHKIINYNNVKILKDLFDKVFETEIIEVIKNKKNQLGEYISLEFRDVQIKKDEEDIGYNFVLAEFEHDTLNPNNNKEIFSYLTDIRAIIKKNNKLNKNLIISGIKPNYLLGYFIIPLFNYITNTLSLKNAQLPNNKSAVVIISKNNDVFFEGELIKIM